MIDINFTLQGLKEKSNHLDELNSIIKMKDATHLILSTAFINKKGVSLIEESIRSSRKKTTFFVGVRNGVTTSQGISKLIDLGAEVYIIDTGLNHRIHHHKVFIAYNESTYRINVGSANLTRGGLLNNIEASVTFEGKFPQEDITNIITTFTELKTNYPENIFKISSYKDINIALKNGQLEDEDILKEIAKGSSSIENYHNLIPPMKLPNFESGKENYKKGSNKIKSSKPSEIIPDQIVTLTNSTFEIKEIWHSKPLKARDLNIKTNKKSKTNSTGSMLLKKGQYDNIDQRTYFREEAFSNLKWITRKEKKYFEDAEAGFHLIIEGIEYGLVNIKLKHDTRTNTKSYIQNQGMTHLHWGEAKSIISNSDLLEKEMKIYEVLGKENEFVIKIQDHF
ncbi:phospholipase D family protein [Mammaliicoccus sciuri]|uniref:hypothetical protein n=1 Tax=Mammaliicoccus sciuri TaxID=1296 RepID=UPI0037B05639